MTTDRKIVLLLAALVAVGRFTIPGHGLTGWPGLYETFAHIMVGVLITLSIQSYIFHWGRWKQKIRAAMLPYGLVLLMLTILEVVMFIVQSR